MRTAIFASHLAVLKSRVQRALGKVENKVFPLSGEVSGFRRSISHGNNTKYNQGESGRERGAVGVVIKQLLVDNLASAEYVRNSRF